MKGLTSTTFIMNIMINEPEIDSYGNKRYYKDGKLHREDGPAIEWVNGDKYLFSNTFTAHNDWYFNGLKINCSSQEEFEKIIKLKVYW
jgi:hypothetical protein